VINPFSDLGKETQNPFLDPDLDFPKKRTQSFIWIGSFERITICLRMNIQFLDSIHFTVQEPILHLLI